MTDPSPLRLLLVDDSDLVRAALRPALEAAGDIVVVGEACNGAEALRLTRKLKPDAVAIDLNMPVMDGVEAVRAIAREKGPPCIMVSSETMAGADATLRALEAGAVDVVWKTGSLLDARGDAVTAPLTEKVHYWGRWHRRQSTAAVLPPGTGEAVAVQARSPLPPVAGRPDLVAVGVSTGGPVTLIELLGALGPLPCPMVVAQHMPASFTGGFAASLAATLRRPVREGCHGAVLEPGTVTVLRGGADTGVVLRPGGGFVLQTMPDSIEPHHPSANCLFRTVASAAHCPVAVVLTGMGEDGTAGARAFAARGFPVLVQDPTTCAVDGMPRAAIRAGVATEVLSVAAIARRLTHWFNAQDGIR